MDTNRREFLKWVGATGCSALLGKNAWASPGASPAGQTSSEWLGVLVDTTLCIGCRKCEWACNKVNNLPVQPLETFEDKSVFVERRRPDSGAYTVVNRYEGLTSNGKPIDVKFQCFHCNEPACYSACLVTAFEKQQNGAVIYDSWRCMGCRYCMVACPFQIPAYEYFDALTPEVRKCTFCYDQITEPHGVPGCVEICPVQCLTFGKRSELLEIAKQKIEEHPDKYIDHIYGEHEAGGTSWMYLASVPFEKIGFARVGTKSPPRLTEGIQHGIFRYFLPPLSLYALLGGIMWLTKESREESKGNPSADWIAKGAIDVTSLPDDKVIEEIEEAPIAGEEENANDIAEEIQPEHPHAAPVNCKFLTRGVWVLIAVMAAAWIPAILRFKDGIGAVTNLNDQYPWGIWIGIDVATGVALAAGGFTTAALAHIFHRERYEAIVRPALLTAMLGYTFVWMGLCFDLGRYYNLWHPILPSMWSGHSVLFEVGMCVLFYLIVLYLEFMPVVCERFVGRVNLPGVLFRLNDRVDRLLRLLQRTLRRVMFLFIIAGVVLSCLHQSSLGSLLLIAPYKTHPLWWTPILPLLFLLSAFAVGYPMVIFESMIASRSFRLKPEMEILSPLARIIPILLGIYLAFKLGDSAIRGTYRYFFDGSKESILFLVETVFGVVVPLVLLFFRKVRRNPRWLFLSATLVVLGVALNRINVFITAYKPPYMEEPYFPSIGEILVTLGLICGFIFCYRLVVTKFPVIRAGHPGPEKAGNQ